MIYLAHAMEVDPDAPVFCVRIGETKRAAKREVKRVISNKVSPTLVHGVEWDDDYVEYKGWIFQVKEKVLYPETIEQRQPDEGCYVCGNEFDPDEWDERHHHGGDTVGEDWVYTCPVCDLATVSVGT